jgi:hypothetical protein
MGRIELEEFTDKVISRIFIADSVKKAEITEDILTENNIDYAVALEPFVEILAIAERNGIAFYVLSGQADYCRKLLASKGLSSGLTVEEPI